MLTSEIIFHEKKFLLVGLCNFPTFNVKDFLFHLINGYKLFCYTCKSLTLNGDFNLKPENEKLNDFCDMNKFERLILKPASFMGLSPSTTDVVLTNHNQSFMKSHVYGAGISDHHKIIFSVLRNTLAKSKLETVFYRCYKKYEGNPFKEALQTRFYNLNCHLNSF